MITDAFTTPVLKSPSLPLHHSGHSIDIHPASSSEGTSLLTGGFAARLTLSNPSQSDLSKIKMGPS